jgi:hypothetical protein
MVYLFETHYVTWMMSGGIEKLVYWNSDIENLHKTLTLIGSPHLNLFLTLSLVDFSSILPSILVLDFSTFKLNGLPMGLKTSSNSFQLLKNKVLNGLSFRNTLSKICFNALITNISLEPVH